MNQPNRDGVTLLKHRKNSVSVVDKKKVFDGIVQEFATNAFATKNLNLEHVSQVFWAYCAGERKNKKQHSSPRMISRWGTFTLMTRTKCCC